MLSVVEPNATGIGGDCFAIISMNGKKPVSYNGSGIAPEKAKVDFFIKNKNLCIYKELLYDSINNLSLIHISEPTRPY